MTEKSLLALTEQQKGELEALLEQQETVDAVKLCREFLDCDLVQAKSLVDGLKASAEAEAEEPKEAGLISPLGIAVLLLILGGYYFIR